MTQPDGTPLLKDKNLHIIFGITLSAVMGVSSIAPALPTISRALDVSTQEIGLLITVFTLPGIFLTPVFGVFADRLGRKRILIPSLLIFGIAGILCGLSTSFTQLLWLRFLQGVGAAALGTLNVTLIGDLYTGNDRATAMGWNGGVLSLGTAVYPAIGGALAILGWHYPFFLSALAIPVGLYAAVALDPIPLKNGMKLSTYFSKISEALKSKKVIGLLMSAFLTFFILYGGFITFMPILLDQDFALDAFKIGALLSITSLMTAVAASQLGRLTKRFAEQKLILTASIIYFLIFISIPSISSLWVMVLPIMAFGVAQGINIPSILNLLTGQAPPEYRAAFLSVNWVIIRIGQTIGPYVLGLVYASLSLDGTFYFTAGVSFIFVVVAATILQPKKARK